MRKSPTGITLLSALIILSVLTTYWFAAPHLEALRKQRDSKNFRDHLAAEIESAEQVDLVEHSGMLDFNNADGKPDQTHSVVEYSRITLDFNQRRELAETVRTVSVMPKKTFTLGIYDPHHTFEFKKNGVINQWLSVCFSSRYLKWYIKLGDPPLEAAELEPEELINALKVYVQRHGLRVDLDWQKIAESGPRD